MNNKLRTTNHIYTQYGSRVTSHARRAEFTQIDILSQNAEKQFFLSHQAETAEKTTKFRLSFLQNKPNFRKSQINVSSFDTGKYVKLDTWLDGKTNPIKPKQTQFKPKTKPIRTRRSLRASFSESSNRRPIKPPIFDFILKLSLFRIAFLIEFVVIRYLRGILEEILHLHLCPALRRYPLQWQRRQLWW